METREREKMVIDASIAGTKGDSTGVVDAGKLPEQKEMTTK